MMRKLMVVALALGALGGLALYVAYESMDRTPGELLRYAERRLLGHPKLEIVFVPMIHWLRPRIERPVTEMGEAITWRGASVERFQEMRLEPAIGRADRPTGTAGARVIKLVDTSQALLQAVGSAKPGEVIELMPGKYVLQGRAIATRTGGTEGAPIVVRARELGQAVLEFRLVEGFHVLHPHWIFENLEIAGACADDSTCEHAFHITGQAHSAIIRNNRVRDFNAHVKVNGQNGVYPDFGLIQANTLFNSRPRRTANPVTPIDIVGADGWVVEDNLIADFVKLGGNKVSYGAFIKGGGRNGRFERNIIICSMNLQDPAGLRVGLSFGGGGTGADYCRNGRCDFEHEEGIAANNIIAHCNDFGVDINRSKNITVAHNTLINTAGIDVRNVPASAAISNNILEGRIRERNGGWFLGGDNWEGAASDLFTDPDHLVFKGARWPADVPALPAVKTDICGEARGATTRPGAVSGPGDCLRARAAHR